MRYTLVSLAARPLSVPLRTPFVIATGRVDVTPNVLVTVEVRDNATGIVCRGYGEGATLPPVTHQTQPDVLADLARAAALLPVGLVDAAVPPGMDLGQSASAGLDMALADAVARHRGAPVWRVLAPDAQSAPLRSDVTIAIAAPEEMARTAASWALRGFDCFKVKVGKNAAEDLQALVAIAQAVPGALLRIDANAGFDRATALAFCDQLLARDLPVQCFEQPCGAADLEGLAAVRAAVPFDVIADESCQCLADVQRLLDAQAVDAINLKLAKTGSLRAALAMGRLAQANGLSLMVGAMVETRLGIAAAAHLAFALGGVAFADLDTAWLLAGDPFVGEAVGKGPEIGVPLGAGLGLALAFPDV